MILGGKDCVLREACQALKFRIIGVRHGTPQGLEEFGHEEQNILFSALGFDGNVSGWLNMIPASNWVAIQCRY